MGTRMIVDAIDPKIKTVALKASEIAQLEADAESVVDFPTILLKTEIWDRLTDEEADKFFAAKKDQPAKFQGMWDDAQSINLSDEKFVPQLRDFLTTVIGAERSKEVLS